MDKSIEDVLTSVMQDSEIQSTLNDPGTKLKEDFLRTQLLNRKEEIEAGASPAYDRKIEAKLAHESALATVAERTRTGLEIRFTLWLWTATFLDLALFGLLRLTEIYTRLPDAIVAVDLTNWPASTAVEAYLVLLVLLTTNALSWFFWRRDSLRIRLRVENKVEDRRADWTAAHDAWDAQRYDLVRKTLLQIINEARHAFFQDRLVLECHPRAGGSQYRVTRGQGLSEVSEPAREIETPYRRRLLDLLESLPGANIGVSGVRGVGKSTILRSISGTPELAGGKALAIYTSAPVRYDPREFLLHIYSLLALRVLRIAAVPDEDVETVSRASLSDPFGPASRRVAGSLLWVAGLSMSLAGLALAGFMVDRAGTVSPAAAPGAASARNIWAVLNFQPGPLVMWGLVALLIGGMILSPIPRVLRRRRWIVRRSPLSIHVASELIEEARDALRDIRFQRSYTTGWSGALKIPVGIEAVSNASLAMSQRPESLPELVEKFRTFVERILRQDFTRVIIAIDELDKIRSAVEAEQFLNEIKSIFNIPKCFYLVSVSENAISSFERRGLAIRDAFDSAFDDIHFIPPLDLDESRQLLVRRVLNLPSPFLGLCHVLSGGLPRDLIRVARQMLVLAQARSSAPSLTEAALDLVSQEAAAKLRASAIAARDYAPDPQAVQLLVRIAELESKPPGTSDFPVLVGQLAAFAGPPAASVPPRADTAEGSADVQDRTAQLPATPDEQSRKIAAIADELAAYLDFLNLVLDLAGAMKVADPKRAAVEALAKARQSLESNPAVARIHFAAVKQHLTLQGVGRPDAPPPLTGNGR